VCIRTVDATAASTREVAARATTSFRSSTVPTRKERSTSATAGGISAHGGAFPAITPRATAATAGGLPLSAIARKTAAAAAGTAVIKITVPSNRTVCIERTRFDGKRAIIHINSAARAQSTTATSKSAVAALYTKTFDVGISNRYNTGT
jgi:hypothetical protein